MARGVSESWGREGARGSRGVPAQMSRTTSADIELENKSRSTPDSGVITHEEGRNS